MNFSIGLMLLFIILVKFKLAQSADLSLAIFFIVGFALLTRVNIDEAAAEAHAKAP